MAPAYKRGPKRRRRKGENNDAIVRNCARTQASRILRVFKLADKFGRSVMDKQFGIDEPHHVLLGILVQAVGSKFLVAKNRRIYGKAVKSLGVEQ